MHFHHSIIINRPNVEVWEFLQQSNSEAAWHTGVVEEKVTSEGGLRVGATGIEVRKVFGRTMEFPWEITEFDLGRKVTTTSRGGSVAWEATYLLEPSEGGTRFTFDYRQEPTGLWKLLLLGAPLIMQRQAKTELTTLKKLVESSRPTGH